jgi:hypothetical protein
LHNELFREHCSATLAESQHPDFHNTNFKVSTQNSFRPIVVISQRKKDRLSEQRKTKRSNNRLRMERIRKRLQIAKKKKLQREKKIMRTQRSSKLTGRSCT